MPGNDNRELTAKEVQLIGEILLPRFTEALRDEFKEVRGEFTNAMTKQTGDFDTKIDTLTTSMHNEHGKINKRLTRLERIAWKALLGYGVFMTGIAFAWAWFQGWLKRRLGMGP